MEAYPVSRAVNNVRNNDPTLLEPIEDPDVEEAEQGELF
jgi:putative SOS response-associated peptidase YedK